MPDTLVAYDMSARNPWYTARRIGDDGKDLGVHTTLLAPWEVAIIQAIAQDWASSVVKRMKESLPKKRRKIDWSGVNFERETT